MDFKERLLQMEVKHLGQIIQELSYELVVLQDFLKEEHGSKFEKFRFNYSSTSGRASTTVSPPSRSQRHPKTLSRTNRHRGKGTSMSKNVKREDQLEDVAAQSDNELTPDDEHAPQENDGETSMERDGKSKEEDKETWKEGGGEPQRKMNRTDCDLDDNDEAVEGGEGNKSGSASDPDYLCSEEDELNDSEDNEAAKSSESCGVKYNSHPIWSYFDIVREQNMRKAKCLSCGQLVTPKVMRMRQHKIVCTDGKMSQTAGTDCNVPRKRKLVRRKRSIAWQYFVPDSTRSSAKCNLCTDPITEIKTPSGATTSLTRHLFSVHGIDTRPKTDFANTFHLIN